MFLKDINIRVTGVYYSFLLLQLLIPRFQS